MNRAYGLRPDSINYDQFAVNTDVKTLYWTPDDKISVTATRGGESMVHRHRNIEMTTERISSIFDPRGMLLSLPIGFSFVKAAVACLNP